MIPWTAWTLMLGIALTAPEPSSTNASPAAGNAPEPSSTNAAGTGSNTPEPSPPNAPPAAGNAPETSSANAPPTAGNAPEPSSANAPPTAGNAPETSSANAPPTAGNAPETSSANAPPTGSNAPETSSRTLLATGDNGWAMRGLRLLDLALPLPDNSLGIGGMFDYVNATSMFLQGDNEALQTDRLTLVWATPLHGLAVGVSYNFITSMYRSFVNHQVQVIGNPTLRVKYTLPADEDAVLHWGAFIQAMAPNTSTNSLALRATSTQVWLLGTATLSPHHTLAFDLGYRNDRSAHLGAPPIDDERLALGIDQATHHVLAGIGWLGGWTPGDWLTLVPFAEVTADWAQESTSGSPPVQLSGGVKARPVDSDLLEVSLGADARLAGAPHTADSAPGLPPWRVFANVTTHIGLVSLSASARVAFCSDDSGCPEQQRCIEQRCVHVVVQTQHAPPPPPPTFVISGTIHDANSAFVPPNALVHLSTHRTTAWSVDPNTGHFASEPLPVSDNLVVLQVTADGYVTAARDVPSGKAGDVVQLDIAMVRKISQGTVHGSVKDAKTGKGIRHAVVHLTLDRALNCDPKGNFKATVPANTYHVLITAPGYSTEEMKLVVGEGSDTPLDVVLHPERKKHKKKTRRH